MKCVLIIEDEKFISEMYRMKLDQAHYHVICASDGKEGLDQASREKIDLIILDLVMPEMSGFDVLVELKKNAKTKKIPVIIASNLAQQEDIQRGKDLGAVDYIIKTAITPADLLKKVDVLI